MGSALAAAGMERNSGGHGAQDMCSLFSTSGIYWLCTGHGRLHVMSCYAPTRTVNSM